VVACVVLSVRFRTNQQGRVQLVWVTQTLEGVNHPDTVVSKMRYAGRIPINSISRGNKKAYRDG
jgi:hypothetical protein